MVNVFPHFSILAKITIRLVGEELKLFLLVAITLLQYHLEV